MSRGRAPGSWLGALPLLLAAGIAAGAAVPDALPGAEPFPKSVRASLEAALAATGTSTAPRTRHRDTNGRPLYSNRLLLEASPYLRQHAHNPVDWHPWGDEAFEKAKRLGRPVLVSIGYSTCHWCHVMEEESFDDVETATQLNRAFVAIKVDREVRPDIDEIYMTAIQAMGERGGWPLNVFLTPERKPFFAGTYFPPEDGRGRPSFRRVLDSISKEWRERPAELRATAQQLARAVRENLEGSPALESQSLEGGLVVSAARALLPVVDRSWGGSGSGMKFPSSLPLRVLMRAHQRVAEDPAQKQLAQDIRDVCLLTLDKMASGGIRDQIGGGFHRYATDRRWLVPHFEKMLYDNALLAILYIEAWQWTGDPRHAEVVRDTLDYLDREMSHPEGGFYSATDADSLAPGGEMEEGWYFTWTPSEIRGVLGESDAKAAIAWWGFSEAGDLEGRGIARTWRSRHEVASEIGTSEAELAVSLERARAALYAERAKRPAPLRDDKVLAAWNGLAISAFARAGFAFDEPRYRVRAERAANFALSRLRLEGRLQRVFVAGRADVPAFLADHAFLIAGLLDLYEGGAEVRWLEEAVVLQAALDARFVDEAGGGYFQTADDGEKLLAREKPVSDGALPSGNAVAAANLLRLHEITGEASYAARVGLLFSAFAERVSRSPASFGELLLAADFAEGGAKEIVLVEPTEGDAAGLGAMLAPLRRAFLPKRVLARVVEGEQQARLAKVTALVEGKRARRGRVTAYVCENRVCALPTDDVRVFASQLGLAEQDSDEAEPAKR